MRCLLVLLLACAAPAPVSPPAEDAPVADTPPEAPAPTGCVGLCNPMPPAPTGPSNTAPPQCPLGQQGDGVTCVQFALDANNTVFLKHGGQLFSWGAEHGDLLGAIFDDDILKPQSIIIGIDDTARFKTLSASITAGAIRDDGRLYTWGSTLLNQRSGISLTPNPVATGTWKQAAFGGSHACGIQSDDSLWCWGLNDQGQLGQGGTASTPNIVKAGDGFAQLTAGAAHTCALKTNGELYCWGKGNPKIPTRVGVGIWKRVTAAQDITCGVQSDSTLHCWGAASLGLGFSDMGARPQPTRVGTDVGWKEVASAGSVTCALANTALYCWGDNSKGQLGLGDRITRLTPTLVSDGWIAVGVASNHVCAAKSGGAVSCWGEGAEGQLGDNVYRDSPTPKRVGTATDWAEVQCMLSHCCATTQSGGLSCWGDLGFVLGNASELPQDAPAPVASSGVTLLAVAESHTLFSSTTLQSFGGYTAGELGRAATREQAVVPGDVGLSPSAIAAGDHCSAAIENGTLFTWGSNSDGQLGGGSVDDLPHDAPSGVVSSTGWTQVSVGDSASCGIRNGNVHCWGRSDSGQLGNGVTASTGIFAPVVAATGYQQVSVGFRHACGVTATGALYCWGSNGNGQLGQADGQGKSVPTRVQTDSDWQQVSAGVAQTCALKLDGSLYCWGVGIHSINLTPARVAAPSTWLQVDVGASVACGVQGDHSLWCWGNNQHWLLGGGNVVATTPVAITIP